jgi:purine-binding chemotaxis protein CheW
MDSLACQTRQQGAPDSQQYLTFLLGGEQFAIGILNIKEIIGFGQLTTVPLMPPFLRGVINLRGAVVPVIDLAARFGRAPLEVGRRTCIVIVEPEGADGQDLGLMVDAVNAVLEIEAAAVEPAPAFGASVNTEFIQGMGKVEGRFVVILDAAHVLDIDTLAALGAAGLTEPASASEPEHATTG